MTDYTLSTIAMIVFFVCFFIQAFFGSPVVGTIEAIAALVAAIALLIKK
jgi:hypothetical protein